MSNSILTLPDRQASPFDLLAEEFRRGFEELTKRADQDLSGRKFIFNRYGKEVYPYIGDVAEAPAPGCIFPIKEGRPVASVDSTCILVGETSDGALYAARCAVGVSMEGSVRRFFRLGPVLVYVSKSGVSGLGRSLSRTELSLALSDHAIAERVIRNAIEARVVESLLEEEGDLVVVADGSLKHPQNKLRGRHPRNQGSSLVGFSKSSSLIFSEAAASSLTNATRPSFHHIGGGQVKTVLAKFSPDGLVFRLDITEGRDTAEVTLGRILWNDAFSAGYPESLKVAHHLSIFSRADDQALKAYVTKRFRLRRLQTFTLRRVALGGFRGGS